MRDKAPGTEAGAGGFVGSTAAAPKGPQGLWAAMAAAAVADDVFAPDDELPHIDFLRRMAEIDAVYEADGPESGRAATVVDFAAARARLRP